MIETRRPHSLLFLAAWALTTTTCGDPINVPNRAPSVAFDSLEADGEVLEIYYALSDLDADDVDIALEICFGARCLTTPTAAAGGDGLSSLPTRRDEPVLHLYRWAAGCDVAGADYPTSAIIRITPGDDEDPGTPVESSAFTLNDLGVLEGCSSLE